MTTTLYWNRDPGTFINKLTGAPIVLNTSLSIGPQFTGTVREWYECLVETLIDLRNILHREAADVLGTGCTQSSIIVKCDPDVLTMLFHPTTGLDGTIASIEYVASSSCPRMTAQMKATFMTQSGRKKTLLGQVKIVSGQR